MPSPSKTVPASRFLGVRLTVEEERRLEQFQAARRLLEESVESPSGFAVELPATRQRELENLVEDGYFSSVQAAAEHALAAGFAEIVRTHTVGLEALRRHARGARDEKDQRRRADREGRELLRR